LPLGRRVPTPDGDFREKALVSPFQLGHQLRALDESAWLRVHLRTTVL
jgi:hypothetical protein